MSRFYAGEPRGLGRRLTPVEVAVESLERELGRAGLTEDQITAALCIALSRAETRRLEADARRRWPQLTGRQWGQF